MSNIDNCRFCHRFMGKAHDESHCVADGWEDDKVRIVNAEICEACESYKSRYIEYPLTTSGIDYAFDFMMSEQDCGKLVKVRPCGEEYQNKMYMGIHLGELARGVSVSHNEITGRLKVSGLNNPAIFVPELKKIIFGCESWWGRIESEAELKEISNDDIDNVWYVKLLKDIGLK